MTLRTALERNSTLELSDNLFLQKNYAPASFEAEYLNLRQKEKRVYSTEVIKNLPHDERGSALENEWAQRKSSMELLLSHLRYQNRIKRILEVGCGNGWLSHNLAVKLNCEVCGMDVNKTELDQAAMAFKHLPDVCFLYGDIFTTEFLTCKFDAVILASSLQYFTDVHRLIKRLFEFTQPDGKIYVVDTPVYSSEEESKLAAQRSRKYFNRIGNPAMAEKYFHHNWSQLNDFSYQVIYDPHTWSNKIKRKLFNSTLPVFPIVKINQH